MERMTYLTQLANEVNALHAIQQEVEQRLIEKWLTPVEQDILLAQRDQLIKDMLDLNSKILAEMRKPIE